MRTQKSKDANGFVQMSGSWRLNGAKIDFLGDTPLTGAGVGLCLAPESFRSGTIAVDAKIGDATSNARIVVGYTPATEEYYSIGIGGYGYAYVIDEFVPHRGWHSLKQKGTTTNLQQDRPYRLRVHIRGQMVSLSVDDVRVLEHTLPAPLRGNQVGLFAAGDGEVTFENFRIEGDRPHLFVVMQFSDPYDVLYREVIAPVADRLGFEAFRADDLSRPGIILQDIVQSIVEADVVIAEITPPNPNIFYELGYAHALRKPTILLADRKIEKLPFDVSGYRVIFYDDTIGGKTSIEAELARYLDDIRQGTDRLAALAG